MQGIHVIRTFIEIIDNEKAFLRSLARTDSAPALLSSKEINGKGESHVMQLESSERMPEPSKDMTEPSREANQIHESINQPMTTVILRNVPPVYSRKMLMELLDKQGFACSYDFLYLPIKIKWNKAFGYAFINFISQCVAERFLEHFTNFDSWAVPHAKRAEVDWSKGNQGFEAQVERFWSGPLMQVSSPDEMKPAILKNGMLVPSIHVGGEDANNDEHGCRRAQKKMDRSIKRMKSKLVKVGHSRDF